MVTIRIGKEWLVSAQSFDLSIMYSIGCVYQEPCSLQNSKSFGVLQLSAKSTLQSYTDAFLHEPGASCQLQCIANQVTQYVIFSDESQKQGET